MKLSSKIFDSIRIKPRRGDEPTQVEQVCEWDGCTAEGEYKAPKGGRAEGQYFHYCLKHVREYNNQFNFFAGMDKEQLDEALYEPPKAESRSTFATGNPGVRTSRTAKE